MSRGLTDNNPINDEVTFDVRILRQDAPHLKSYWETHRMRTEPGLNVTSVLQRIAMSLLTTEGRRVAPVAYDACCLEEVCGACTMLINGRTRQACSALVSKLLDERPGEIELRPMSKFPVIRDLVVDRRRLFRALEKLKCWIVVDGYHDLGPGPRQTPAQQERAYPLSTCMSCGCCLEACPQYKKIDLVRATGESAAQFSEREQRAFDRTFVGAHANSQVILMNSHPIGQTNAAERLDLLMARGGLQNCGKAANCEAVCPKEIPLMTSWARAGRATTVRFLRRIFDE